MKTKSLLQDLSLWLYIFGMSIMIGAAVFQMFVIIPEFTRAFPEGMLSLANSNVIPGKFWGSPIVGLAVMVLPLVAIIINWKTARRKWLLIAFCLGIATSVCTSIYFIPRLQIMGLFNAPPTTDMELLRVTVNEWIAADQLRFWFLIVPAFACLLKAAGVSSASVKSKKSEPVMYEAAVAV